MSFRKLSKYNFYLILSIFLLTQIIFNASFAENSMDSVINDFSLSGFKVHKIIPVPDLNGTPENVSNSETVSKDESLSRKNKIVRTKTISHKRVYNKKYKHYKKTYNPRIVSKRSFSKKNTFRKQSLPKKVVVVRPLVKTNQKKSSDLFVTTQASIVGVNKPVKSPPDKTSPIKTATKPEAKKSFADDVKLNPKNNNKFTDNSKSNKDIALNLSDYPKVREEKQVNIPQNPVKEPNMFSLISSLFFVIVLILLFGWLYNKLRGINPSAILSGRFNEKDINQFNLLATSSLGQGKNIHLVEINGKQLVIGSTANNINLLTEIKSGKEEALQSNSEIPDNEFDYSDPESYLSRYPEIYKEYLAKDDLAQDDKQDD